MSKSDKTAKLVTKRLNVDLEHSLYTKFKSVCLSAEQSMSDRVRELVKRDLAWVVRTDERSNKPKTK